MIYIQKQLHFVARFVNLEQYCSALKRVTYFAEYFYDICPELLRHASNFSNSHHSNGKDQKDDFMEERSEDRSRLVIMAKDNK